MPSVCLLRIENGVLLASRKTSGFSDLFVGTVVVGEMEGASVVLVS